MGLYVLNSIPWKYEKEERLAYTAEMLEAL